MSFDHERLRAIFYLIVVPLAIAACLAFIILNWRSERQRNDRQIETNRQQIKVLRNALGEACHATTVLSSVNSALILHFAGEPHPDTTLIQTLAGQGLDLASLSACGRIGRP